MTNAPSSSDNMIDLAARVRRGERRALAKAITRVESDRPDHQDEAVALLELLRGATAHDGTGSAVRVGISGTPGVGKSTFIEAIGARYLDADASAKLAVLAVDPSSPTTGGSILGDKTRMERLATSDRAYVRPSPSGGALGGVAAKTREAMLICEAAGYGAVLIETVGVGQSEHAVSAITDTFVLLVAPGGGDDLQGQKRGVLELADIVVVHKADGPRAEEARATAQHYRMAGHLLHHDKAWQPPVLLASSQTSDGLADVWRTILEHRAHLEKASPGLAARRAAQAEAWLWSSVEHELMRRVRHDPRLKTTRDTILADVRAGRVSAARAARALVDVLVDDQAR